jgi:hypothetical protein
MYMNLANPHHVHFFFFPSADTAAVEMWCWGNNILAFQFHPGMMGPKQIESSQA